MNKKELMYQFRNPDKAYKRRDWLNLAHKTNKFQAVEKDEVWTIQFNNHDLTYNKNTHMITLIDKENRIVYKSRYIYRIVDATKRQPG